MNELDLLSDYLIENNFASSYEDAIQLISVMSEDWMEEALYEQIEYLEEKRRFKAVRNPQTGKLEKVRQQKTPLTVPHDSRISGSVFKMPGESDWRLKRSRIHTKQVLHPDVAHNIRFQGGYKHRTDLKKSGLLPNISPEHLSSPEYNYPPSRHGTGSPYRGVKKKRGQKAPKATIIKFGPRWKRHEPETTVSKFKKYKENRAELERQWSSPQTASWQRREIGDALKAGEQNNPLTQARVRAAARRRQQRR